MPHPDAPTAKRRRTQSPELPPPKHRSTRQSPPPRGPRGDRPRSRDRRDRRDDRRRSRSPAPPRGPRGSRETRQRSPPRAPRQRSRSRERRHERDERNGRQGTTSRREEAGRDRKSDKKRTNGVQNGEAEAMDVEPEIDPETQPWEYMAAQKTAVARMMGFGDFRSTKNTKVPGNDKLFAVSKYKKTEYRQYMNRTGGFNRPLSPA